MRARTTRTNITVLGKAMEATAGAADRASTLTGVQSTVSPNTVRIAGLGLLAISLAWFASVYGDHIASATARSVADRILNNQTFRAADIDLYRNTVAEFKGSSSKSAEAILALRTLEDARSNGEHGDVLEERRREAERTVLNALRASPQRGYFWYALFVLRLKPDLSNVQDLLPLIAESYRWAPAEGWISIRRAPMVLGLGANATPEIRQQALDELMALVDQRVADGVVTAYWTGDAAVRDMILQRIALLSKKDGEWLLSRLAKFKVDSYKNVDGLQ